MIYTNANLCLCYKIIHDTTVYYSIHPLYVLKLPRIFTNLVSKMALLKCQICTSHTWQREEWFLVSGHNLGGFSRPSSPQGAEGAKALAVIAQGKQASCCLPGCENFIHLLQSLLPKVVCLFHGNQPRSVSGKYYIDLITRMKLVMEIIWMFTGLYMFHLSYRYRVQ